MNQLTVWTLNGGAPEAYTYDSASGNLDVKAGVDLTYNDAAHAHAVKSTDNGTPSVTMDDDIFTYDANGNMTLRDINSGPMMGDYVLSYDAENRLVEVKKNSVTLATFVYDGDGRRVKSTVNSVTTYFVGAHYEVTGSTVTKYYFAGTQRVAMRSGSTLSYLLTDHLGSTSLVVKDTITGVWVNDVVSELRYKPWGETRYTSGTTQTKYQFTGQFSYASDFGLLFYNARWYDPAIGRFTSADTIIPPGIQGLDRYSYVLNNPIRYTDPSGHAAVSDSDGNCKDTKICRQKSLERYTRDVLKKLSGKDDLEAIARVIDYAAVLFPQYDDMIPALSEIFLGVHESNPLTVINASGANPCAAIGREPKDCGLNADDEAFWDRRFHSDFQDRHSQAYHFWAFLATTASTDMPVGGFALGFYTGNVANIGHEILKYEDPGGAGATWQDYALSQAGMDAGLMIAFGLIQPNELGDYVRDNVGPNGGGAGYVDFLVQYLPLWGN